MPAPTYLPEAIPTALGWAHPLTGEQLDVTSGLENPVDYYKPNARNASFIDPEGETEFLGFAVVTGRRVRLAVHTLHPIVNVEWDFADESDIEVGGYSIMHVFPASDTEETYTVAATVNYLVEGEDGSEEASEVVTIEVVVPPSQPAASGVEGDPEGQGIDNSEELG